MPVTGPDIATDTSLANDSRTGPLGIENPTVGINDLQITNDPGTIALLRELGSVFSILRRTLQSSELIREVVQPGEAVFHIREGDQNLLPIDSNGFIKGGP